MCVYISIYIYIYIYIYNITHPQAPFGPPKMPNQIRQGPIRVLKMTHCRGLGFRALQGYYSICLAA